MALETDTALIARARRGEGSAQEELVRRYLRPTYAVALAVLRHPSDAEDMAQETLMAALQRLEQCRDTTKFAAWLFQSARNRCLNWLEQNRVRSALLDSVVLEQTVEVDPMRVLQRQRLLSALTHVSAVQREVVLLHDLQSWTHAEIAEALDISEVMSRQHLFTARKTLRQHLGEASQAESQEVHHE
jgi:RNA polymerase sigma-70 factor (ECF subfamily)